LREGYTPGSNLPIRRLLEGEDFAHIPDMAVVDDPIARSTVESGGLRTLLSVALRKDGRLLGQIVSARKEVRPFADKEISLLRSFAAQAVIAMENARLLGELRERTDELFESLKLQTATADVLKVISRSTFDLKSVLHTLVESATRLCEADKGTITRLKDGAFYREEAYGFSAEFVDYVRELPVVPGRADATGRALLEGRTVHIADVEADPDFTFHEGQRLGGFRTVLAVPMLREGQPIGAMALTRSEVRPFTDKQVEMVSTFADQAVIAIENSRLITEQFQALERQTATAEVLLAALDAWNGERAGRGEPALSIGIGLNYGPAVMGDVGSDQGLSFTVIGDTVNTASRLQGLTRDLKTPLVVADAIVSSIDGAQSPELKMLLASLLDQGEQALKGRSGAVRIWTKAHEPDRRA
jgi:GAF domain-containing protein